MILDKPQSTGVMTIDLTGPEGNAYNLLGLARFLSEMMDKNAEDVVERMKDGDYENLVQVFDQEFGDLVILYR